MAACADSDGEGIGGPLAQVVAGGNAAGSPLARIAAGGHHTCAIMADETVRCWGAGNASQLGQGRSGNSSKPLTVPGASGIVQVALGYEFSCALSRDGRASCWGANPAGALGNGRTDIETLPVPVNLPAISRLGDFALGHWSSCAVHGTGALSCWGDASRGQLGEGSVDSAAHPNPRAVGLRNVQSVALGYFHACAVHDEGKVSCWGSNGWGETGSGSFGADPKPVPQTVTAIGNAVQLAAGQQWSCALRADTRIACWGDNRNGQLGDGSASFRLTPTPVGGLDHVIQIAAGRKHVCAVKDDGTLWCWGRNAEGQLGIGSIEERRTPTQVTDLSDVKQVALGDVHTCALLGNSKVYCFGENTDGRLGDGTTTSRNRPIAVVW